MVNFLDLTEDARRTLIEQVSRKEGMTVKAVEKDWWITLTLHALFSLPMAEHFIFKGGTSLSKGWKLIERFSEDIDIALAPEAFGRSYVEQPSHSYVKRLKKEGCAFSSSQIREALATKFIQMGVPEGMIHVEAKAVSDKHPDTDPQTLYIQFPSLFEQNSYLIPPIKVEFSVRSLREPFTTVSIQSFLGEFTESPAYTEVPFQVRAVEPRKTFMEKLMLLHEKFQTGRGEADPGERQSRHLFDLFQMAGQGIVEQVVNDPDLYARLLEHRRYWVRLSGVNYDVMQLQHLLFLPPSELLSTFQEDYRIMQEEMIYRASPRFDELLDGLRSVNRQFAGMGHGQKIEDVIQQSIREAEKGSPDLPAVRIALLISPTSSNQPDATAFVADLIRGPKGFDFHQLAVSPKPLKS